jgi:type VI secretion system secreted protein VgrG
MEDEGIFYFFKHEKGKHTLVLADAASAHTKPDAGESKVEFFRGVNDVFPLGKVFDTKMTTAVNTGGYSLSDTITPFPKLASSVNWIVNTKGKCSMNILAHSQK